MNKINAHTGRSRLRAAMIGGSRLRAAISILLIFIALAACHCGSDPTAGRDVNNPYANSAGLSSAKLVVSNSNSVDPKKAYGEVKKYKVTVSGPGIEVPIEKDFDGNATGGVIDGIPVGADRAVKIEAINLNSQLIREGEAGSVVISPGQISEIEVELDAVPIFINLDDGNVVANNRLKFELFADPEDPLEVEDQIDGTSNLLFDLATSAGEVWPDVVSGVAAMAPQAVSTGEHVFKVASKRTGKSSSVTVNVIDGSKIYAAPLFSGGTVDISGEYVGVARAGSAIHASAGAGAVWPRVLEAVLFEY